MIAIRIPHPKAVGDVAHQPVEEVVEHLQHQGADVLPPVQVTRHSTMLAGPLPQLQGEDEVPPLLQVALADVLPRRDEEHLQPPGDTPRPEVDAERLWHQPQPLSEPQPLSPKLLCRKLRKTNLLCLLP